jgi:hypothetical protein
MTVLLKNNVQGYLANAVTSTDNALLLTSGGGAVFPSPQSGEYFYATISTTAGSYEVVKCISRAGDILIVVRGQEDTTAIAFAASSRVEMRVTAQSIKDAITDRDNATLVIYNPSGAGAVATTVQTKLREFASVMDYGAIGNGVADDTVAIQAAVNANDAVFFPAGTYKVTSPVTLKSNNILFGEGGASVINYSGTSTSRGAFFADSGSASAYVENLTIQDLKIVGQVATLGFSEFIHLVSLHGVRNCLIERCIVEGFRGDGIIFGSGLNDPVTTERHNINVTVRDCYIDGINADNRNGISVIDGDGVTIHNNYITRCSRSNMPGAIDIEPDNSIFHVIRNVSITDNHIYDCRGGVGVITVFLPIQTFSTSPYGFNIENNYIHTPSAPNNNNYGIFFEFGNPFATPTPVPAITDATPNLGVRIVNNRVRYPEVGPGRCLAVWNINDAVIADNTFYGGSTSLIGYPGTGVFDLELVNNSFTRVNGTGDYAISIYTGSRIKIDNNTFKDCGGVSGAARGAIEFNTGTTSYVKINNNVFTSPNGTYTQQAVRDSGHTFTPATNQFFGNIVLAGTNQFQCHYSDTLETNWSPTVEGGGSAGTGTYGAVRWGKFRRVGSLVFFRLKVAVNSGHTGTGVIEVSLPTAVQAELNNEETACSVSADGVASTGGQIGWINPAALVGANGCVRIQQTGTGTISTVTIPAGAFTVYASGYYIAA